MAFTNRREYVESEFAKWNNEYDIPFEQVFDVKAILDLEHQYLSTPDDHVKTKSDIVHTMQRLKSGLRLKCKNNAYMISIDPYNRLGLSQVDLSLHVLNLTNGELKNEYINGVDYADVSHKLVQKIKNVKPIKILCDKAGKGATLFDVLKMDLRKHEIKVENNGDVTYLGE